MLPSNYCLTDTITEDRGKTDERLYLTEKRNRARRW